MAKCPTNHRHILVKTEKDRCSWVQCVSCKKARTAQALDDAGVDRLGADAHRSAPTKVNNPRRSCLDKRGYWTMTQARTVADKREQAGAPKLRIYKCERCLRYHLTKMPLN